MGGDKLYLATSEYFLPSGRSVQRSYQGEKLIRQGNLETQENFDHALDSQLADNDCSAYLLKNGVAVYGGEGIVPDIIVSEPEYPCWFRKSIYDAEAPYLHQNAEWLLESRLDSFDANWTVPDSLKEVALANSRLLDTTISKIATAQNAWEVPLFLKWYIAFDIWGDKGTFAVRTRHSAIVKRALDVLRHPSLRSKRSALSAR